MNELIKLFFLLLGKREGIIDIFVGMTVYVGITTAEKTLGDTFEKIKTKMNITPARYVLTTCFCEVNNWVIIHANNMVKHKKSMKLNFCVQFSSTYHLLFLNSIMAVKIELLAIGKLSTNRNHHWNDNSYIFGHDYWIINFIDTDIFCWRRQVVIMKRVMRTLGIK